jgi:hypothetical protein
MMHARLRSWLGLLVLPTALACATPDIDAQWDPRARFEGLATWSWAPIRAQIEQDEPRLQNRLVQKRIQQAIVQGLAQRGYAQVRQDPDFLVAYHAAIDEAIDTRTMYNSYRVVPQVEGWALEPSRLVERYEVGTLLVDVFDSHSKELIWRGRVQSRVQDLGDPGARAERTNDVVRTLLEQFPPPHVSR